MPRLGPWQPFRFTFDPVYHLGHPRLWLGHGNFLLKSRDSVTEVRFPLQNLRYLRLLEVPDGVTLDGQPIVVQSAYAEMEVYGRGFAPTATWESQIVALGGRSTSGEWSSR